MGCHVRQRDVPQSLTPQELKHGPWIPRDQVHGNGDSPGRSRPTRDEENSVVFFEQRHGVIRWANGSESCPWAKANACRFRSLVKPIRAQKAKVTGLTDTMVHG